MNTFALVYTLRTQDMWVPHLGPKGAALTRFSDFFFVLDHFNSTKSKYYFILFIDVFLFYIASIEQFDEK